MAGSTSRETFAGSTYPTCSTVAGFISRVAVGKGVTSVAMSLSSILRRYPHSPEYVCPYGHGLKVARVNTRPIAAQVVNLQASRYLSLMHLIGESVHKLNLTPSNRELSVASTTCRSSPVPATRPKGYPSPESGRKCTAAFWATSSSRATMPKKAGVVSLAQAANLRNSSTTNNATLHGCSIAYGAATCQ